MVQVPAAAVGLTVGALVVGAGAGGMVLAAVVVEGDVAPASVPVPVGVWVASALAAVSLWALAVGVLAAAVFWL
ncbi:hypothetical protein [Roseateles toxinivorans]|uniref:hypothetical protein n=1 Tax=Roseateles toxinivorans TaxID=270368 RepID=UPI00105CF0D4|nr:hypothetical protein [Roseateles toxinivorans]